MKSFLFLICCLKAFDASAGIETLDKDFSSKLGGQMDSAKAAFQGSNISTVNYYSNLAKGTNSKQNDPESLRGATEIGVYQKASQGTVLIVSGDSLGSGALITNDGHIISNAHVTGDNNIVTVFFKRIDGKKISPNDGIQASVKKIDEVSDLVLIEIDPSKAPKYARPIVFAKMVPQVGADAHAIGHPAGQLWTYTKGYISQLRNNFEWIDHKADVIQVQTPINPGNSGGPLLNNLGELIGINSFKDTQNESMNFAVSLSTIKRFLSSKGSQYSAKKSESKCEVTEGETYRSEEKDEFGPSTNLPMATDCDKRINLIVRVPDDKSKPIITYFDSNKDGKPDIILADSNRDGKVDYSVLDLDSDGVYESRGIHNTGKFLPDKIVAINE